MTLSGNLIFSNNTAVAGTAFILVQSSVLFLTNTSQIEFENNYAINIGGVFYIDTNQNVHIGDLLSHNSCFLSTMGNWHLNTFMFLNNSAGVGDILYGGQVSFSLDGNWNCLESFKSISTVSPNSLSLISSDPSRVCLCNGRGWPDCMILFDPTPRYIYPGQTIVISAVTVGQNFGTVAGSVHAQFLSKHLLLKQLQIVS